MPERPTMTIHQLLEEYDNTKVNAHSYRFGQHFINRCVRSEEDEILRGLWDQGNFTLAYEHVLFVCKRWNWDLMKLPIERTWEM